MILVKLFKFLNLFPWFKVHDSPFVIILADG